MCTCLHMWMRVCMFVCIQKMCMQMQIHINACTQTKYVHVKYTNLICIHVNTTYTHDLPIPVTHACTHTRTHARAHTHARTHTHTHHTHLIYPPHIHHTHTCIHTHSHTVHIIFTDHTMIPTHTHTHTHTHIHTVCQKVALKAAQFAPFHSASAAMPLRAVALDAASLSPSPFLSLSCFTKCVRLVL